MALGGSVMAALKEVQLPLDVSELFTVFLFGVEASPRLRM